MRFMRFRCAALAIVALAAPLGHAEVFKCQDAQGQVTLQSSPCPGGVPLGVDTQPSKKPPPQGLRPAEKQLLEQIHQREQAPKPVPVPPPPPPSTPVRGCPGIAILAFDPFQRKDTEVRFIGNFRVQQNKILQCARLEMELSDFFGRLRDSVAQSLQGRLIATFADGRTAPASKGELSEGPNRFGVSDKARGTFCFGHSEEKIVEIGCQ